MSHPKPDQVSDRAMFSTFGIYFYEYLSPTIYSLLKKIGLRSPGARRSQVESGRFWLLIRPSILLPLPSSSSLLKHQVFFSVGVVCLFCWGGRASFLLGFCFLLR